MEKSLKRFFAVVIFSALASTFSAVAQEGANSRAAQDINAFVAKFEEGDSLFNQKKYAEAAAALAAANELYNRALRRDANIGGMNFSLKPGRFPALRYYGYGFTSPASLSISAADNVEGSAAGLRSAALTMWLDAALLGGLDKAPFNTLADDPLDEVNEDNVNRLMGFVVPPVASLNLPVPDEDWHDAVVWSRRANLLVEWALQKYPDWKTGTREWAKINGSFQHTGNAALADIKAKLAEAEPEYAKIAADARKAAPSGVKSWIGYKIEDIDKAISGAKQNGWVDWSLARDIFITKDYISNIRKNVAKQYADEAKTMPADALKPLEEKVAELKAVMVNGASKWKFPTGKPRNAAMEAKAAAAVKSVIPGATVIKSALDSGEWIITKNDLDIPTYRSLGVLVHAKVPGQSSPWLIFVYVRQSYAGGGTYNAGGTAQSPTDIRIQAK